EGHAMTDGQKDAWAGVFLTALMVGILLGGLLVLRLTGNETLEALSARRHPGCSPRESLCLAQPIFLHRHHAPPYHDRYVLESLSLGGQRSAPAPAAERKFYGPCTTRPDHR